MELLGSMLGSMLESPRTSCGVGDPLLRGTLVGNNPKVGLSLSSPSAMTIDSRFSG